MADAIDAICADLGIRFIRLNEYGGPLQTKAGPTIREIGRDHGDAHLIAVLQTFTESLGNERALKAPCLWAVSDIVKAHPGWLQSPARWFEAFDGIDLLAMMDTAKRNRDAVPSRRAIATMLHAQLSAIFDPPEPVRNRRLFKSRRRLPRGAALAA